VATLSRSHPSGRWTWQGASSAGSTRKAVGADETIPGPAETDTPLGFVAVRQEFVGPLRSTGGRPGFPDAERRKIPVTQPVWRIVAQATETMAGPGFHPGAAQVANAILAVAVRTMRLRRYARPSTP
jgi:hypothetical protein